MAVRSIHGACPHDCPDTCGLTIEVEEGRAGARARALRGAASHSTTRGWLCTKVRDYLDWVYHPERLLTPLRRCGKKGKGDFTPISWDEALAEIAARWTAILATEGGAALLPYSYSGTLGLLQMSVASSRLWNRLGASGLERSICGAAAEAAVRATLGARFAPRLDDLRRCKLLVLWGHNPASTAPHSMAAIREAQRAGCELVVIDPRRTRSAKTADLHLAPRPATDAALALALIHIFEAEGAIDWPYLHQHAIGAEELLARARSFTAERVAAITGLEGEAIVDLARRMARRKPMMIKIADGLQRHGNGGQLVRAVACLPALLGQIGKRGGGLFYTTSDTLRWNRDAVGHADDPACPPTPRMVNMNRLGAALTSSSELGDGPPIRALYVFGANPAASAPNAGLIARGLARDNLFTVVHELFLTDTARYADIVLPATSQLEQLDLHKGYGHHQLTLNQPAIPPRGEARSNWDAQRAIAAALGLDEPWLRADGEQVLREILAASASQPALAGVDYQRLVAEGTVEMALADDYVPFADGVFPTPSGKIELYCEGLAEQGLDPLPAHHPPSELADDQPTEGAGPLVLISGAAHAFINSSLVPLARLQRLEGPPTVELHPNDAARRGIEDGQHVRVYNERGGLELVARVTDTIRPGVAFSTKGRWGRCSTDGRNVNWTTPDALADLAGQSTFHSNQVWVEAATEDLKPPRG
ncbi:MAG: molybdopterin oxidoreductase [Proteobacteria bacterium]|nr:MAG: molybdopterin oxidoreductase [Pseudomonadota bacterium]